MGTTAVFLRYYDLSRGMAQSFATALIGSEVEGIWHTGLEVFGHELFFGGGGVQRMKPVEFELEHGLKPAKIVRLGDTSKSLEEFNEFVRILSPRFTAMTYDLLEWNCNHFTNECCKFLLGHGIPDEVLQQHQILESSPMGKVILNMIRGTNMANPVGASSTSQRSVSPSQRTTPSTLPDSPLFPTPTSASGAAPQFVNALNDLLARHCTSNSSAALLCLDNAATRVISNATCAEHRRLSKADAAVRDLCSTAEGVLALMALGFEETDSGWEFPSPNAASLRSLMEARALLRRELQRQQQPQRWEHQLQVLVKMGFTDQAACLKALKQSDGSVNGALDRLLS